MAPTYTPESNAAIVIRCAGRRALPVPGNAWAAPTIAPDIQELLLFVTAAEKGHDAISEKKIRGLAAECDRESTARLRAAPAPLGQFFLLLCGPWPLRFLA
jgi:hypothetical protein